MINVKYCNVKRKECSSCYAKGDILSIEHGSEAHTTTFFLCQDCSEELRDKLEEYGDFEKSVKPYEKLQAIEWEIDNSDMGTAVDNIIRIVKE